MFALCNAIWRGVPILRASYKLCSSLSVAFILIFLFAIVLVLSLLLYFTRIFLIHKRKKYEAFTRQDRPLFIFTLLISSNTFIYLIIKCEQRKRDVEASFIGVNEQSWENPHLLFYDIKIGKKHNENIIWTKFLLISLIINTIII